MQQPDLHGSAPGRGLGDGVETLLRAGAAGGGVPRDRQRRVLEATRRSWLRLVQGRRRRRALLGVAAAIAASLLLALLPVGHKSPTATTGVRVEALVGGARAGGDALAVGDRVSSGAILTTAPAGALALRMPGGASLRLDGGTRLRLVDARQRALALERGAIYVDSGSGGGPGAALRIATRFGVVEDVGTQFEVRLADDGLRIDVREGLVELSGETDGNPRRVVAGSRLTVAANGAARTGPLSSHDGTWAWLAPITPAPDIDGMTARGFLDWAARETGFRLAFADDAVARTAERIVLQGSAAGLSPRQALDAVLPTCGLAHRFDGDALVIDLRSPDRRT